MCFISIAYEKYVRNNIIQINAVEQIIESLKWFDTPKHFLNTKKNILQI